MWKFRRWVTLGSPFYVCVSTISTKRVIFYISFCKIYASLFVTLTLRMKHGQHLLTTIHFVSVFYVHFTFYSTFTFEGGGADLGFFPQDQTTAYLSNHVRYYIPLAISVGYCDKWKCRQVKVPTMRGSIDRSIVVSSSSTRESVSYVSTSGEKKGIWYLWRKKLLSLSDCKVIDKSIRNFSFFKLRSRFSDSLSWRKHHCALPTHMALIIQSLSFDFSNTDTWTHGFISTELTEIHVESWSIARKWIEFTRSPPICVCFFDPWRWMVLLCLPGNVVRWWLIKVTLVSLIPTYSCHTTVLYSLSLCLSGKCGSSGMEKIRRKIIDTVVRSCWNSLQCHDFLRPPPPQGLRLCQWDYGISIQTNLITG